MTASHPIAWLVLLLAPCALANPEQGRVAAWLAELNRDVWIPFMDGVSKDDESLYLRVRSRDYIRVQADTSFILTYDDYVDDTVKMMQRYKDQGARITIDVRFDERIVNGRVASESGVSRVRFAVRDGELRTHFGRFHTISRKENGAWRVVTEYFPAATASPAGEAEFLQAHAPDDTSAFRCYMPYPEKRPRCDN